MTLYHAYYVGRRAVIEARGPSDARQKAIVELSIDDRYSSLVTVIRADQDDSVQKAKT